KGDFERYCIDLYEDDEVSQMERIEKAENYYRESEEFASQVNEYQKSHPYLSLMLNWSVMIHDNKNEKLRAIKMADSVYNAALEESDDDLSKGAMIILDLIKTNSIDWGIQYE
ncbi:MAG: hypothetical protein MHPSP_001944, partial [Paramarteilia canceri]